MKLLKEILMDFFWRVYCVGAAKAYTAVTRNVIYYRNLRGDMYGYDNDTKNSRKRGGT